MSVRYRHGDALYMFPGSIVLRRGMAVWARCRGLGWGAASISETIDRQFVGFSFLGTWEQFGG